MINFYSENISFILKNKTEVRYWILNCIKTEKKISAELSFIFCSDSFLKKINKKFLDHDHFTDIITFPYSDPNDKIISGDIYISIDRVKENSKTYKTALVLELHRVMIHGVLHLCGYGDKSEKEIKRMRSLEDKYLQKYLMA